MFEQLDKSLEDFMVERKRQHVPLREVRPVLLQVSAAGLHYLQLRTVESFAHVSAGQSPGLSES